MKAANEKLASELALSQSEASASQRSEKSLKLALEELQADNTKLSEKLKDHARSSGEFDSVRATLKHVQTENDSLSNQLRDCKAKLQDWQV